MALTAGRSVRSPAPVLAAFVRSTSTPTATTSAVDATCCADHPSPSLPQTGAQPLNAGDCACVVGRGDLVALCACLPRALLVAGEDEHMARRTAAELRII
jgi:hypothetical protein